ncbi:hypothetical protein MOOR_16680 [Moorella thermoacetica]|uniref:Uncharacterized protein n=1 Tax=Neomoorella thermoacetica TaxID=1525 RepID=A0A1J5JHU3_NEOTH|nr:hypothetical protein [Moorella thermoacetica]OIQ08749.1 hypothetical protein MOOR_16680 [Moorella thermoacetica]
MRFNRYFPLLVRLGPALLAALVFVGTTLAPDIAYAYDLKAGAMSVLDLAKIVVMIAVLIGAVWSFFKNQVATMMVIIIVGAVLIAITTPGLMDSVGKAIVALFGGSSSTSP